MIKDLPILKLFLLDMLNFCLKEENCSFLLKSFEPVESVPAVAVLASIKWVPNAKDC